MPGTSSAAVRTALAGKPDLTFPQISRRIRAIECVLCGVDGSEPSLQALALARSLSVQMDSELLVAHAAEPGLAGVVPRHGPEAMRRQLVEHGRELLDRALEEADVGEDAPTAEADGGPERACGSVVEPGAAADVLLRLSVQRDAGLIVLGSRGRGMIRSAVLGSVSANVLARSRRPVLLVSEDAELPPSAAHGPAGMAAPRLLCGVDGSVKASRAVSFAAEIAGRAGGELVLTHVRRDPLTPMTGGMPLEARSVGYAYLLRHQQRRLEAILRKESERQAPGLVSREMIVAGEPAGALEQAAESEGADMIVIGSENRGAIGSALLGSTALSLMPQARRPVLIVPVGAEIGPGHPG